MSTPAGWYPQGDGRQRYWDGSQWTEHFAPGAAAETAEAVVAQPAGSGPSPVAVDQPAGRPWCKKTRFLIPGGVVALVLVGSMASAASGGGTTESPQAAGLISASSAPTATSTATATAEPVDASVTPSPSATPTTAVAKPTPKPAAPPPAAPKPVAPKPAAPSLTVAQENAKGTAQDYLDMSGFSKKGLVDQLKFEGYKAKDIDAALATMKVNWNNEAAESAKSYVEMSHFSRRSLIEQLKFEGYTSKQAAHGADSVGL